MIQVPAPFKLRRMQPADMPGVMAIENRVFPTPWPAHAYEYEISRNPVASCLVLEIEPDRLIGYGCVWIVVDEIHVSTLAVAPEWRGRGLGELLLLAFLYEGISQGAIMATLEVRVSNQAARNLYSKYGFEIMGRRKRYYTDNREDALVMTVRPMDDAYCDQLAILHKALVERLCLNGHRQSDPHDSNGKLPQFNSEE